MATPAPLYAQVKRYITDRISRGELTPGARLPSEHDLVRELSVSRMTVSRALRELTQDGAIVRVQGVGSFVSENRPKASVLEIEEIGETIAGLGGIHLRRLIATREETAEGHVASLMELAPGSPLLYAAIAHFDRAQPMQLEQRYARPDFAPDFLDIDFEHQSAYDHFQSIAPETELEHVVEAARPNALEQTALSLGPDHPVLRIRRRTWIGERIVTLGWFTHPHETYRVVARVSRVRSGSLTARHG